MLYDDTMRAVEGLTDHVRFKQLVTQLLARLGHDLRPIGGSGDLGRDAVGGLYRAKGGEPLAVTISLNRQWARKITADLKRIVDSGFRPESVISVTNRATSQERRGQLQEQAHTDHKINLTVNDQRWLVVQLHRRENLDLRGEYLNLPPPRPRVFLDTGEYEERLQRRGLLSSHFLGRNNEVEALEQLVARGRSVILEGGGGLGKTRVVFELARSGHSSVHWFFVDADMPFDLESVAELDAGYDAAVLIDDAHRRSDLPQLLASLERREPMPRLVFTVRPGHAQGVHNAVSRFAFGTPATLELEPISRSGLVEILQADPFRIEQDAMVGQLLAISEGNVAIALIGAQLVLARVDPTDLSQSELFAGHVESRLAGAGLDDRASRSVLALVAALGVLKVSDPSEAGAASALLEEPAIRRRLNELADAGLLIEDEPRSFTVKPDIVREHIVRSSFFPDSGRPIVRFDDVYEAFAPTRLRALLQSLGDARVDLATGAEPVLALIRTRLLSEVEAAESVGDLASVIDLLHALGAGGASIVLDVGERIVARLARAEAAELDALGPALVQTLSAAKFGRDQLGRAWRLLLQFARIAFATSAQSTQEAALAEIRAIYSVVPVNYSANDGWIVAYVQDTVSRETILWWDNERELPGAVHVAAAAVKPAFTLGLESHRQSAGNAMAVTLTAGFLPASAETERMIQLGVRLFTDAFLQLTPADQLSLLDAVNALEHVAGGYPGILSVMPSKELQLLAAIELNKLEEWLAERVPSLPLVVAGGVVSHFAMRGRRPKKLPSVKLAKATGDLREYLDLVDSRPQAQFRLDWERQVEEARKRGRRYGRHLAKDGDWKKTLERWSGWINEFEALTGNTSSTDSLYGVFAEVAAIAPKRSREIVAWAIEQELPVVRAIDGALDALLGSREDWPLVETWQRHKSPSVRQAALRAVYGADDELARPVLTALVRDSDRSVVAAALHTLMYGSPNGPSGWRLDLALETLKSLDEPLEALDQLLMTARLRRDDRQPPRLTKRQKDSVREIVLGTAARDELPRMQRLAMTLAALEGYGLDLALEWLDARLAYLRQLDPSHFVHPLPDELAPFVRTRWRKVAAKAQQQRLLAEIEAGSLEGMYRHAVYEAITWLGDDSSLVTEKVDEWIRSNPRLRRLALSFVNSGNWKVFTERARAVLDARPDDPEIVETLIGARAFPRTWIGSMQPYFQSQADAYRKWARSRDRRLRALGAQAVAEFERRAEEAVERERREREAL